jgi:hypothetical protein
MKIIFISLILFSCSGEIKNPEKMNVHSEVWIDTLNIDIVNGVSGATYIDKSDMKINPFEMTISYDTFVK